MEEVPDIQAIVSVILGLFIQLLLYPGKLRRVGLCKFSFLPSAFSTSALCFSDSLRYLAITFSFSCFRLVQAALSSAIFRACVSASASSLAFLSTAAASTTLFVVNSSDSARAYQKQRSAPKQRKNICKSTMQLTHRKHRTRSSSVPSEDCGRTMSSANHMDISTQNKQTKV
jgi:hypothetical protein